MANRKRQAEGQPERATSFIGNNTGSEQAPLILVARQICILQVNGDNIRVSVVSTRQGTYYPFEGLLKISNREWRIQFTNAGKAIASIYQGENKVRDLWITIMGYKRGGIPKIVLNFDVANAIVQITTPSSNSKSSPSKSHSANTNISHTESSNIQADPPQSPDTELSLPYLEEDPSSNEVIYYNYQLEDPPNFSEDGDFMTTTNAVSVPTTFQFDLNARKHAQKHYNAYLQQYKEQAVHNWFWFSVHTGCKTLFWLINFSGTGLLYKKNAFGELPIHVALRGRKPHKLGVLIVRMMGANSLYALDNSGVSPVVLARYLQIKEVETEMMVNMQREKYYRFAASNERLAFDYLTLFYNLALTNSFMLDQPESFPFFASSSESDTDYVWEQAKMGQFCTPNFVDYVDKAIRGQYKISAMQLPYAMQFMNGSAESVPLLSLQGFPLNEADGTGAQPIHYATFGRNKEMVLELIARGVPVNAADLDGLQPIHYAVLGVELFSQQTLYNPTYGSITDSATMVQVLVQSGANVSATNSQGLQPIHFAVCLDEMSVVDMLVSLGARLDATDANGRQPLHYASDAGNLRMVQFLLESGVAPDLPDHRGRRPLHYAAHKNNMQIIQLLVNFGANLETFNNDKRKPAHLATQEDVVEALLQMEISGAPPMPFMPSTTIRSPTTTTKHEETDAETQNNTTDDLIDLRQMLATLKIAVDLIQLKTSETGTEHDYPLGILDDESEEFKLTQKYMNTDDPKNTPLSNQSTPLSLPSMNSPLISPPSPDHASASTSVESWNPFPRTIDKQTYHHADFAFYPLRAFSLLLSSGTSGSLDLVQTPNTSQLSERYYHTANAKFAERNYEQALLYTNEALKLEGDNAFLFVNRGMAKKGMELYEEAISDFDRGIELDPSPDFVFMVGYQRGLCKRALGKNEEAIKDLNTALEVSPDDCDCINARGVAYKALGMFENALQDFDRVIALRPTYSSAYCSRGIIWDKKGNAEEALNNFNKAIEYDPQSIYYLHRAMFFNLVNQYKSAIQDLDNVLELNPNNYTAFAERGMAKFSMGDLNGALRDYSVASMLNVNNARVIYGSGNVKLAMCNFQQAIQDFDDAIELGHGAMAFYKRGYAKEQLSMHKEAIEDFNTTIQLTNEKSEDSTNSAWMSLARGRAYYSLQNFDAAIQAYNQVLCTPSKYYHPFAHCGLGTAYAAIGNQLQALGEFNRALALDPYNTESYLGRALAHQQLSMWSQAFQDFENSIAFNPWNTKAYYHRGVLRLMLGQVDAAIGDFNAAISKHPTFSEAHQALAQAIQLTNHLNS